MLSQELWWRKHAEDDRWSESESEQTFEKAESRENLLRTVPCVDRGTDITTRKLRVCEKIFVWRTTAAKGEEKENNGPVDVVSIQG